MYLSLCTYLYVPILKKTLTLRCFATQLKGGDVPIFLKMYSVVLSDFEISTPKNIVIPMFFLLYVPMYLSFLKII